MAKPVDLSGKVFNQLTAIRPSARRTPAGGRYWICRCSCGNECERSQTALASGRAVSCGCARRGPTKARSMPAVRNYLTMHGPASVPQIARVTGLCRATVQKMVSEMRRTQMAHILRWENRNLPIYAIDHAVGHDFPKDAPRPERMTGSQRVAKWRKEKQALLVPGDKLPGSDDVVSTTFDNAEDLIRALNEGHNEPHAPKVPDWWEGLDE